jgi:DNA-binding beta-propeller fold protein YncE
VAPDDKDPTFAKGQKLGTELAPLPFWGRGLAGSYSVIVNQPAQPDQPNPQVDPDFKTLGKIRVRLVYDAFAAPADAAQLQAMTLSPATLVAGATALATLTLRAPAPQGGTVVKVTSSNPAVDARPATVPAGERSVRFPITVAPEAAGQRVVLTASTPTTSREIALTIPKPAAGIRSLKLDQSDGVQVTGASDGRFLYATQHLSLVEDPNSPATPGNLFVIDPTAPKALKLARPPVPAGIQPSRVVVSKATGNIYVLNRGIAGDQGNTLTILNRSFQRLGGADVPLGGFSVIDMAVLERTPQQGPERVYITRGIDPGGSSIVVEVGPQGAINLQPNGQPKPFLVGRRPQGIAVDQQAHLLYITRSFQTKDESENVVEVIDPKPATPTITRLYTAPDRSQPVDVVFDPAARRLYVAMLGNAPTGAVRPNVTAIDLKTKRAMPILTRSLPLTLAIDARGQVYASSGGGVELIPAGVEIVPGGTG